MDYLNLRCTEAFSDMPGVGDDHLEIVKSLIYRYDTSASHSFGRRYYQKQ